MQRHRSLCAAALLAASIVAASEHRGQVTFRGFPVPGATVTADQNGRKLAAITDQRGFYSFPDLVDGTCVIEVGMFGFAPISQTVAVAPEAPVAKWELSMLPPDRLRALAQTSPVFVATPRRAEPKPERRAEEAPEEDLSQRAADGFLINGSVNNGAASPFAQAAAFGNNRSGGRSAYSGGIALILGNSALDARPFSLTGQITPKAAYNRVTGIVSLGGPLQIPRLFENGPNFFLGYQWSRNSNATVAPALMPTAAEREGIFAKPVLDPLNGAPFPGNEIPPSRTSSQAQALLRFYPLPNSTGSAGYNYQVPILSPTHQDTLNSRLAKTLGTGNYLYGQFNLQRTRSDSTSLFGFLDKTGILGINTGANWWRRISSRLYLNLGYQFSRLSTRLTPHFQDRENVSGEAGITGNNQDPMNWGPPALNFSSGIASLADAQSSFNRNQTSGVSWSMLWNGRAHNITVGGDFRRQEFNYLSQEDPRGTLTFTGAETGSDFADFLLGIPATSSIAFGNADKYFHQSVYDAFITDDWRIGPAVTLNAGARWDYETPITELYGRLVNLDIVPGFAAAAPVVASDATGALTLRRYPGSLIQPYRYGLSPRVGLAWRPVAGSSLIVRAGYGIYYDTSVYQSIALRMAQQPPLSKAFSIQNSRADPLTLANAFSGSPEQPGPLATARGSEDGNTFAVDPGFRPGYAQNWQISVQRDLPGSLQLTASYLGIKGTHAMQASLPNTYPAGATNPCPGCPAGFAYLASGGNSSRHAGQVQLRRRLRSGFTATLAYTFSKSIDDAAALARPDASANRAAAPPTGLGNLAIAQDWRDLAAGRGLSSFDQRHVVTLQTQYSTGMGLGGGTLLSGWKGALSKGWTLASQVTAGTGLPQTPVYFSPVEGTGITGTIRPDYTGAPLYAGRLLNPAAYSPPRTGQWGNAGRNSITGPAQFLLNASLGRTFQVTDRSNLDLRIDANNALNRVNFSAWNTTVNSRQFGWPAAANAMRSLQTTLRWRF